MKVVKHTKRFVVQWLLVTQYQSSWEDKKSFNSLKRAQKYARSQVQWMPYKYRVIDTQED